jgi:hypothetical protein
MYSGNIVSMGIAQNRYPFVSIARDKNAIAYM